jgi:hypothetical protein
MATSKPYKLLILAAQQGCTVDELVFSTLKRHGGLQVRGSIARAAEDLGVSQVNLSRYLNNHTYPERQSFQTAS